MVVTPLQLANAYAAMVNGGTLWQPRVVDQVVDSDGENLRRITNHQDIAVSPAWSPDGRSPHCAAATHG